MSMQRELDLGLALVVVEERWLKVRIRQYPNLSFPSRHEDLFAAPAKGDLVRLTRLLV